MGNSDWLWWVGCALSPSGERVAPGRPAMQGFRNFRKTLHDSGESGPPQHHATRPPDPSGSVRLTTRTVLSIVVGRGMGTGTLAAFRGRLGRPIQDLGNFRNSLYSHGQNRLQTRLKSDLPTENILICFLYRSNGSAHQFSGMVVCGWKIFFS